MRKPTLHVSGALASCSVLATLFPAVVLAGAFGIYSYPNVNQDPSQQTQDRLECHQWAVSQTGFDPSVIQYGAPPAPAYAPPPPQGGFLNLGRGGMFPGHGLLGDAATGAALGAAGGAIAGDAGEGAALGALASTLFSALSTATQPSGYGQGYYGHPHGHRAHAYGPGRPHYRATNPGMENFKRAYAACMTARNYTVRY